MSDHVSKHDREFHAQAAKLPLPHLLGYVVYCEVPLTDREASFTTAMVSQLLAYAPHPSGRAKLRSDTAIVVYFG